MIEVFRDEILISPLQEYIFAINSKLAIFSFCSFELLLLFLRTSLFFNSAPTEPIFNHVPDNPIN